MWLGIGEVGGRGGRSSVDNAALPGGGFATAFIR